MSRENNSSENDKDSNNRDSNQTIEEKQELNDGNIEEDAKMSKC